MPYISLPCPAKLNLFLHILGRRPDGYHELQTLFQLLNYGDQLHLEAHSSPDIALLTPIAGVDNNDNLIIKAAKILKKAAGFPGGANIKLDKILPMGGGIGGGSSNAATTLVGLNHLWKTGLSLQNPHSLVCGIGTGLPCIDCDNFFPQRFDKRHTRHYSSGLPREGRDKRLSTLG